MLSASSITCRWLSVYGAPAGSSSGSTRRRHLAKSLSRWTCPVDNRGEWPVKALPSPGFVMKVDEDVIRAGEGEIVDGDASGGPNTSHTIVVAALAALLEALPPYASRLDYERAVLDDNVLGKAT